MELHEKKISEVFKELQKEYWTDIIDDIEEKLKQWAIAKNKHCDCTNKEERYICPTHGITKVTEWDSICIECGADCELKSVKGNWCKACAERIVDFEITEKELK